MYNNAFDKSCAKPSSLEFCHGEKGYHGMEPESQTNLLKGKQQNTTKRTVCTVYILAEFVFLEMNRKEIIASFAFQTIPNESLNELI